MVYVNKSPDLTTTPNTTFIFSDMTFRVVRSFYDREIDQGR